MFFPQSTCQAQQSQRHSAANVISLDVLWWTFGFCRRHYSDVTIMLNRLRVLLLISNKLEIIKTQHFPWWFSFQKILHGNGLHKSECLLQQSSGKSKQTTLYELRVGLIMRVSRHVATARNGCGNLKQKNPVIFTNLIYRSHEIFELRNRACDTYQPLLNVLFG